MLEHYLTSMVITGKSEKSIATRRLQLMAFLKWLEDTTGTNDVLEITKIDAVKYRNHLQEKGAKPNTVNTHLSSIESFCTWMVGEGLLTHNPVKGIKRVETAPRAPRGLTKNERHRLMRVAELDKNHRNGTLILTLLFAGLRVSELTELTPEDVVIGDRSGTITVRAGKGNKYRTVPIVGVLRKRLGEYIVNHRSAGKYLFPGQRDPKLSPRAVQLICKEYGEAAKIDNLTPHVLRHTLAHNLVEEGSPLGWVAAVLGHASVTTTMV